MVTTTKSSAIARATAKRDARPKPNARLVSRREMLDRVGISYPKVWLWMREGTFPRSRQVGGKVFWIESELEKWIADLPVKPLKGDAV